MSRTRTLGRRTILGMAVGLAAPAIVRAESYPAHPVRVVNAYSPGGTADVVCRILCSALSEKLGQTFAVDNKPGAAARLPRRSSPAHRPTATRCCMTRQRTR